MMQVTVRAVTLALLMTAASPAMADVTNPGDPCSPNLKVWYASFVTKEGGFICRVRLTCLDGKVVVTGSPECDWEHPTKP